MSFTTAYAFEAKEIQGYILDRTRMREMVGASGIIDSLCNAPLDQALDALNLTENSDYQFCRRGGGGFTLLFREKNQASALRDLISLIVPHYAPHLPFVHAVASAASSLEAIEDALKQLKVAEQQPQVDLPLAGPLTERSRRTGLPAVAQQHGEYVDAAARTKQRFAIKDDTLAAKFLTQEQLNHYRWPVDLNPKEFNDKSDPTDRPTFPYLDGAVRYLAIIHIDGNGFGQALKSLRDAIKQRADYAEIEYAFSQTINEIGQTAAQQATTQILIPAAQDGALPARPLLLGGDDLTLLVRGDVALPFATAFIEAFERESQQQLRDLSELYTIPLPDGFTACGGIAYIGAKQPFYRAYHLTEKLCDRAKTQAKAVIAQNGDRVPSAIAFDRITNLMEQGSGRADLTLAGAVYATDTHIKGLPPLNNLLSLQREVAQESGELQGLVKKLHTQLSQQSGDVALYRRWRETHSKGCATLDNHLHALGSADTDRPVVRCAQQYFSPLGDVKNLIMVHNHHGESHDADTQN
ncbi:hypothetical protein D5085_00980 [Ectothiorhodospiraceae bacterium BW-2]|nr:hypothetical protein D5085_00980 [Ectothiorhodospiraceae bacterium BW-2]